MHGGAVIGRLSCRCTINLSSMSCVPGKETNLVSKPTHSSTDWLLLDLKTRSVEQRSKVHRWGVNRALPIDPVSVLTAHVGWLFRGVWHFWKRIVICRRWSWVGMSVTLHWVLTFHGKVRLKKGRSLLLRDIHDPELQLTSTPPILVKSKAKNRPTIR